MVPFNNINTLRVKAKLREDAEGVEVWLYAILASAFNALHSPAVLVLAREPTESV